jgi:hypothetical protein
VNSWRSSVTSEACLAALVFGSWLSFDARSEEVVAIEDFQFGRGVILDVPAAMDGEVSLGGGIGDVNGDGYDDVLIFAQPRNNPSPGSVVFQILLGRSDLSGLQTVGIPRAETITLSIGERWDYPSVSRPPYPMGDVLGDSVDDFLVGFDPGSVRAYPNGAIFLVTGNRDLGKPDGILQLDDIVSRQAGRVLTSRTFKVREIVSAIGDFDGDGAMDVAVTAGGREEDRVEGTDTGQVIVLFAASVLPDLVDLADVPDSIPGLVIKGPDLGPLSNGRQRSTTSFGMILRGGGDVDGDGYSDLVIRDALNGYLIHGRPRAEGVLDLRRLLDGGPIDGVTVFEHPDGGTGLRFGSANIVGDVNGDGIDDIAAGITRQYLNPTMSSPGHVYLIYGRPDFPSWIHMSDVPPAAADVIIPAVRSPDRFGAGIGIGDVNADGFDDVAMAGSGQSDSGELFVLYGGPALPREIRLNEGFHGFYIGGESPRDHFGSALPLGDFNGDGVSDFVVSADHLFPTGPQDRSRVYIVYGPGSGEPSLRVLRVTPRTGPVRGGTGVEIRGAGFAGTPSVTFGGSPARGVRVISPYVLEATTPAASGLGPVDVGVELAGERRRLESGYEYVPDAPAYDLTRLGDLGLVVEGDPVNTPAVRGLGAFTSSPMAFADLDGDGFDEFAVISTSPMEDWLVTVVRGGAGLAGTFAAYEATERVAVLRTDVHRSGLSGGSVSALGDLDGDGIEDFGIGTWLGLGWVVFGRPEGLSSEVLMEQEVDEGLATMIDLGLDHAEKLNFVRLGDADGNGRDEFALGHSQGGGEIAVLELSGRRPETIDADLAPWRRLRVTNVAAGRTIGQELVAPGDVDGDGAGDLFFATDVSEREARVYLLSMGADLPAQLDASEIDESGHGVELSVREGFENARVLFIAGPGDVNGDGLADLLVGVWGGGDLTTQGIVYLIYGSPSLPARLELVERPAAPDGIARILGEGPMEQAGVVGAAGDWNGDGLADFLIGAPGFQDESQPGKVYVLYGARDFPERLELSALGRWGLRIDGRNAPGGAGFKVGPSGDINGDGEPDFAFAEAGHPWGSQRAYVILGPYGGRDFVRGEINLDGVIDIADAVFLLSYLFLGGEGPPCADAADVDDNGRLEITDAVRLLGHLFLGDQPPPLPHPTASADPTDDALECLGF